MKRRLAQFGGLAAAAIMASLILSAPVKAQEDGEAGPPAPRARAAGPNPASAPTPRTPDGHPDLTGMWRGFGGGGNRTGGKAAFVGSPGAGVGTTIVKEENGDYVRTVASRRCAPNQKGTDGTGCQDQTNQNIDYEMIDRENPNRPLYRPEFWDKVQDLDYTSNFVDPVFKCQSLGVPRIGTPTQIFQNANFVVFLYAGFPANEYRVIPTDGRQHSPDDKNDILFLGDSVGHWEGDTLVVDSIGYTDQTWLASGLEGGYGGFFHSYDMHVIEKLTREGNVIHYQAIVDDPTVLLQPWAMDPKTLTLNPDPKAYAREGDPCDEVDPGRMALKIRH